MSDHSAILPSLGYDYQKLYALFLLLENKEVLNNELSVKVEGIDDIELTMKNSHHTKLIQVKYRSNPKTALSNANKDLWKTIRIWSEYLSQVNTLSNNVLFILVTTTSKITRGSIAELLSTDEHKRDPKKALSIIKDTVNASKSNDRELKKDHEAFKKLSEAQKKILVEKIEIHHSAPDINKLEENIKLEIRFSTYLDYVEQVFTGLKGWWLQAVFNEFNKNNNSISYQQVNYKLREIADGFKKDNLPLRYQNENPSEGEQNEMDTMQFVRQLTVIKIDRGLINLAKRAYFRAYRERYQWQFEFPGLLNDKELERYEATLIEQWENKFFTLKDDFLDENEISIDKISDEKQLKKFGRSVYKQVKELNIPIRERVRELYMTLGSYHILANKESSKPGDGLPKIYWHPKYKEKK